MTCADVADLLDRFVDAELPAPMLLAVARHAGACPACDTAARELTGLRELLGGSFQADAERLDVSGVWPAVARAVDRIDTRRTWVRRMRLAPVWGVVRAAEHGPSDAQLVALRPRLRRLAGYRSFQVVRQERRQCVWQNAEAFKIPGGHLLHVMPKGMRDQAVIMQVKLLDRRRPLIDT